jgi:hypothetical protein
MEKQIESQNKRILAYLKSGRKITPLDGLYAFGTMRLSARIYDLRRRGEAIESRMITITSPAVYSGKKRVKQYWIKKAE